MVETITGTALKKLVEEKQVIENTPHVIQEQMDALRREMNRNRDSFLIFAGLFRIHKSRRIV